jgi:hypothetical protein
LNIKERALFLVDGRAKSGFNPPFVGAIVCTQNAPLEGVKFAKKLFCVIFAV